MSVVQKNIIANMVGKGASAMLSFVFVPFYLKFLGAEAYGLIGLYVLLQSVFMMADMGLSGTFIRETAKLTALEGKKQQLADLCRTFEVLFAAVGFVIALVIVASSHLIAEHWVNLEKLSITTVSATILLIGITIGLQFPFFIYQGGMQGLQRQTPLNILLVSIGLLRGGGALLVLAFLDSSIEAYFMWQVVVSVIQLVAGRVLVWRNLLRTPLPPRFDLKLIFPLWRFAVGMAGITLSGTLLTQVDKLILIRMLPLEKFGYYALAGVVATVPGIIAFPVNNAVYPRFTQLVATRNFTELTELYHRSCQILSVLLIPTGLTLAFFSKEVMLVWTGSAVTAQNTFLLVTLLVTGFTLMGLMMVPYALQLAFAWTKLGLYLNIVAVITLIPSMIWLVSRYGVLGACFVWIALYTGQIIVMIHFMHRRIIQEEKWKWYINDIGKPLILPLIIVTISRFLIDETMTKPILIASLSVILFVTVCASAMSATYVRNIVMAKVISMWRPQQMC